MKNNKWRRYSFSSECLFTFANTYGLQYEGSTENSAKGPCTVDGHFCFYLERGQEGDLAYPKPQGQCTVEPPGLFCGAPGKGHQL
jgi:hypothetical protein